MYKPNTGGEGLGSGCRKTNPHFGLNRIGNFTRGPIVKVHSLNLDFEPTHEYIV